MTLLSKNSGFVKTSGRFFPNLWPCHNVLTLKESQSRIDYKYLSYLGILFSVFQGLKFRFAYFEQKFIQASISVITKTKIDYNLIKIIFS